MFVVEIRHKLWTLSFYDTVYMTWQNCMTLLTTSVFFYQQFPVAFDLINESATMNWYTVVKVQLYGL